MNQMPDQRQFSPNRSSRYVLAIPSEFWLLICDPLCRHSILGPRLLDLSNESLLARLIRYGRAIGDLKRQQVSEGYALRHSKMTYEQCVVSKRAHSPSVKPKAVQDFNGPFISAMIACDPSAMIRASEDTVTNRNPFPIRALADAVVPL